jgi:mannose-6-phosphate isomerase-like protein (cupin superfamily)
MSGVMHEKDVKEQRAADRWSKDLIGGSSPVKTTSGFNLGVAEYHVEEFGPRQVHDDQEAVYVVSGVGEITVSGTIYRVSPGSAVYIPAKAPHATRRTGKDPVKVVYTHGAV